MLSGLLDLVLALSFLLPSSLFLLSVSLLFSLPLLSLCLYNSLFALVFLAGVHFRGDSESVPWIGLREGTFVSCLLGKDDGVLGFLWDLAIGDASLRRT